MTEWNLLAIRKSGEQWVVIIIVVAVVLMIFHQMFVKIFIKKAFKTVCKIAQVEDFRFHDLRHTSATRMVQACVPINVVQKILNHASVTTTMRYSHTMREQEQNAVELLSSYSLA